MPRRLSPGEAGAHGGRAGGQPAGRRFPLVFCIGVFAAAFLALAWPWLSGRVTIPWDAKAQFLPQLQFLAASLAKGESPFWTPYVFAGWPQLADPQSLILSPLHLLLAALTADPSFRAADAVTFAYLFLGGLGIILLFRDRGWHAGGALVAALMFAFGGSAASRIQHTGQVMSIAYLALALWLLARALARGSWRVGIAAGLVAGLLANERDQVAMLGLYVLAGFVVAHWLSAPRSLSGLRRSVAPLAATALTAALVCAVPLTMTALLALDSNRPEIAYAEAGRGSLHPAELLMLVFGNLYGASMPDADYWGPPSFIWSQARGDVDLFTAQNVGQVYAGMLAPVAVLGLGLARGLAWTREARFFTLALLAALVYALGRYTPAFRLMYEAMPGVDLFRRPADATFVVGVLLALLTGYLVHRWLAGDVPPAAPWQRAAEIALALALVAAAFAVAALIGMVRAAVVPILTGAVLAVVTVAALAVARRLAARSALAAAVVMAVLVTADLWWMNGPNESTALPPAVYDALRPTTANATVALIRRRLAETAAPDRRDRVELIGIGYHWPNLSLAQGFDHVLGHNPLRLRDFARATCDCDTVAAPDQRTFAPLFPSYRSTFADVFGLRLIATGVPVDQIDRSLKPGDLKLLARTADAYVYENPRALPRVMLVPGFRVADFDGLLQSGWPDGVDPRASVLLERAPAGFAPSAGAAPGTARIARYANTEVVVETEAAAPGFLLLTDVWHPWWHADVDGKPADILKADVLFRAVALTAGRHRVRFAFHPFRGAWEQLLRRLRGRTS
jgi:hypothetical protein